MIPPYFPSSENVLYWVHMGRKRNEHKRCTEAASHNAPGAPTKRVFAPLSPAAAITSDPPCKRDLLCPLFSPKIMLESQQLVFLLIWKCPTSKLALTSNISPVKTRFDHCFWPRELTPIQHPAWLITTASMCPSSQVHCVPREALLLQGNRRE